MKRCDQLNVMNRPHGNRLFSQRGKSAPARLKPPRFSPHLSSPQRGVIRFRTNARFARRRRPNKTKPEGCNLWPPPAALAWREQIDDYTCKEKPVNEYLRRWGRGGGQFPPFLHDSNNLDPGPGPPTSFSGLRPNWYVEFKRIDSLSGSSIWRLPADSRCRPPATFYGYAPCTLCILSTLGRPSPPGREGRRV